MTDGDTDRPWVLEQLDHVARVETDRYYGGCGFNLRGQYV